MFEEFLMTCFEEVSVEPLEKFVREFPWRTWRNIWMKLADESSVKLMGTFVHEFFKIFSGEQEMEIIHGVS